MKLNTSQERAVAHLSGPMMVLAGPGSGKTSTIVGRIEYLVHHYQVDPFGILVVTFSRAAAREMKERYLQKTGKNYTKVTFGTFHGIFYGILKQAYGLGARNILPEEKKFEFLRQLTWQYGEELTEDGEFTEELAREISLVKNSRIPLEHYYSSCCCDEIFKKIFKGYQRKCRKERLLDFDDMLVCCYELLSQRKDILAAWQKRFSYILVDEYQDINQIQYVVLRMLALPENNLFIVGDDDQSIYHFRGAKPEIMLHFNKDFPTAKQELLSVNYRCTGNILKSALHLIGHNKNRFPKQLETPNEEGAPVEILDFQTPREQNLYLLKELQKEVETGGKLEDSAVLVRTNLETEGIVRAFMDYNLPFHMKEKLPNIYEHWIARDLIAYLKLARGERSRSLFLSVMNRPNRYLSREAIYEKQVSFETLRIFYEGKEWMCDRIDKMEDQIKVLASMPLYGAINFIRKGIGYEEYLQEYASYRRIKPEELMEVLNRIHESTRDVKTLEEWEERIHKYTQALLEQAKNQNEKQQGVLISTLHGSKGLEFKNVFILNINEGNIPYKKAVLDAQVEEERRLFYVGMTRAKKRLTLCYVHFQFEKQKEKSRFLGEVMET